jgi:prevent-host-death family protein
MTYWVEVHEAQADWDTLLDMVAHGDEIIITRRGKAAARLLPAEMGNERGKAESAVAAILEIRQGVALDGLSIKDLVNEGRK